ncbi:unnamed protein product [Umbelopsis vinacea]
MSKPSETKSSSNLTAIIGLKALLEDLSTQWHLNDDNNLQADSSKGVDSTTRQDFLRLTTAVRTNCSQFESEVIGDVTNWDRCRASIPKTPDAPKALSNDSSYFATMKIKALQEIAEDLGLACYLDTSEKPGFDSPVTTITTAGNIIVVDIDVDEKGEVLKAKLTYATDIHQDDKLDKILLKNLKEDDLSDFRTNLSALSFFDNVNTKHSPIDFFVITKNLMEDLRTIYNQEILMASNDPGNVLNNGHGIPQMHFQHPGLSIYFWAGPVDMLETQWGQLQVSIDNAEIPSTLKEASRMWITFADSSNLITYPPASKSHYLLSFDETQDSMQAEENGEHFLILDEPQFHDSGACFRYLKPLPSHPEAVTLPVCFVAKFDKPIVISDYISSRLANLVGLPGNNTVLSDRDHVHSSEDDISLETLLINDCLGAESIQSGQLKGVSKALDSNMRWNVTIDSMQQNYVYVRSNVIRGKLLHRIPFEHPVQLFGIMQTLRKQIVFNHLFRSVFNPESMPKETADISSKPEISLADLLRDDADDVNTINLEVAILQAPTTIQVTLMAPKSDSDIFTLVSFTINVPDMIPTSPTVTMQKPTSLDIDADNQLTWNSEIFDQQKMSSIIQKTYSIPLLARWLWQKMKASSGPYVVSNSAKKSFARSNSYFDKSDKSNKRLRSNLGPSASQPGANGMDID